MTNMIVTVTANPGLDRTLEVDVLVPGAVLRTGDALVDPGGKGVNVSRALVRGGCSTVALFPSGGLAGQQLELLLTASGITPAAVAVRGTTRINTAVVEADGTTTKLNEPGPELSAAEARALVDAAAAAASGARWLVAAGSLPPYRGATVDLYAEVVRVAKRAGCAVALDTSGPALVSALAARPDLAKPNREELSAATGRDLVTLGDVIEACSRVRDMGARSVLASLGSDGAVLVGPDEDVLYGTAPVRQVRSTVGAGDALLAGFISFNGSRSGALAEGLAWGAAATSLRGSEMPRPTDLDRSTVRVVVGPDPDLRLTPQQFR